MDFTEVVNNRRSVREYIGEPVTDEEIQKIMEIVNRAPSAGNLQAYEVYVVKNKDKKEALVQASYGQEMIAGAEAVLVFIADKDKSGVKYGERGENLYSIQDATIAAAYSQLAATSVGVGSCWIGAFSQAEVKQILNIPKQYMVVVLLPMGYPAQAGGLKSRKPLEKIISYEPFSE